MNIDLLLDFTSMKRVHASQSTKMFVSLRCFRDVSKDLDQKAKIDSKLVKVFSSDLYQKAKNDSKYMQACATHSVLPSLTSSYQQGCTDRPPLLTKTTCHMQDRIAWCCIC